MAGSSSPKVTLVIPALNEEPVLSRTLMALPPGLFQQVIVADNGSSDSTAAVALQHGATVVFEPRRGYGGACLKALAALPPDTAIVVFLQADGSEDPAETRLLLQPIVDGRAALVLGSRTLGRAEAGALLPHQAFGNLVATTFIRLLYGHRYSDLGPFRAITVDALRRLHMRDRNYGWTVEMQVRALEERISVLEVPVTYRCRAAGVNKVSGNLRASLRAGWVILTTILRLRLASASRRSTSRQ
ncbi:MAG: glycosyltransferase [Candidatus Solibacter usitatus]|nr:glycosyltransferase [Candidatus Solibacter usitatus]